MLILRIIQCRNWTPVGPLQSKETPSDSVIGLDKTALVGALYFGKSVTYESTYITIHGDTLDHSDKEP